MRRTLLRSPAFARDLRSWLKSRPGSSASIETTLEQSETMNPQSAGLVLYAITGVALLVWLISVLFVWRASASGTSDPAEQSFDDVREAAPEEQSYSGTAEVAGLAAELSRKAASYVAQGKLGVASKIVSQTDGELRFEPLSTAAWSPFERARLTFRPLGSRTEVRYEVTSSRSRGGWLMMAARVCIALGLTAIAVGFWAVQTYVVQNPNPEVRWQVFQMLQVAHFVWPAFLFAALHRAAGRWGRNWSENLIGGLVHNLPYLE